MGLHFKLDDLPDAMRLQVMEQLSPLKPTSKPDKSSLTFPQVPTADDIIGGRTSRNFKTSRKHKSRASSSSTTPKRRNPPVRFPKRATPNETEAKFNREFLDSTGKYEPVSFSLPSGAKYTPDWLATDPITNTPVFWEIKGGYHLGSHGRAVLAFKEACVSFPMFTFAWAELLSDGRTWNVGVYQNGEELKANQGTAHQLKAEGILSA